MLRTRASERSSAICESGDYRRQTEKVLKTYERVKSMRPRPSPMVSFAFELCTIMSELTFVKFLWGVICRSQTKISCVKSLLILFDFLELDAVCPLQLYIRRHTLVASGNPGRWILPLLAGVGMGVFPHQPADKGDTAVAVVRGET